MFGLLGLAALDSLKTLGLRGIRPTAVSMRNLSLVADRRVRFSKPSMFRVANGYPSGMVPPRGSSGDKSQDRSCGSCDPAYSVEILLGFSVNALLIVLSRYS